MSLDGNIIIIVFDDKIGWLWDIKIEEKVGELEGYVKYIISVCVWGRYVFISFVDVIIRKWNLENGFCIKIMKGYI